MSNAADKKPNEQCDQDDGDDPPEPANSARPDFSTLILAEFLLHELVIVKLVVWQAQPLRVGASGPAGFLVGAALGTGARVARHFSAALGTDFGRGFQMFRQPS